MTRAQERREEWMRKRQAAKRAGIPFNVNGHMSSWERTESIKFACRHPACLEEPQPEDPQLAREPNTLEQEWATMFRSLIDFGPGPVTSSYSLIEKINGPRYGLPSRLRAQR